MACLNYFHDVDKEGHLHDTTELKRGFNKNFNKALNAKRLMKLEKQLKENPSYELLSDYSVRLMNLGKYKEALEILEELYQHHPDVYQIASNLGTAYELNGQLDNALKYICIGMDLNPDSHGGSEWIHEKILQTKIAMQDNPGYLKEHNVLELNIDQEHSTVIRDQLEIQLRERFPFSPAPNQLMANLLIDLGDCYANTRSIEYAKALYTIARLYYGDKAPETEQKINEMIRLRGKYTAVKPDRRPKTREGSHFKQEGISYRTILDDNDKAPVNWAALETDPEVLLRMGGY